MSSNASANGDDDNNGFLYIINTFSIVYKENTNIVGKYANGYKRGSDGVENFTNLSPAALDYRMGPKDSVKLTNCPKSYWRHPPANEKLMINKMYVPQGTPLPLIPSSSGPVSVGPNVDGTNKTPKDMFMFAYNQCKPECCPSTYSCDRGCVCTSKQQRKFLVGRGNNKTRPDDDQI